HRGNVSLAHQLEAIDDISHLRVDHQHDRIVTEAGIGSEEHKKIREAADGHAEIRAQAVAPRVVNLEAVPAEKLHADELLRDAEARAADQAVHGEFRAILRGDASLPHVSTRFGDELVLAA